MRILLHICCGVCAAGVAEKLTGEGHDVVGFFFNPNIHPSAEYERRLDVAEQVSRKMGFPLVVGEYRPRDWLQQTLELRHEPEGGRRCEVCFRMRLVETFRQLPRQGADAFTTTLTVSPHKSAALVNRVGREISTPMFLERDFKKKEGFKRSIELAKQWGLYRQDYCGCIYSLREGRSANEHTAPAV